ncbi:energy transducer TonB [Massilia consociata]|uniref:Energy transducer TonB n=1 Tax=Massilia consociata TaxID=760117 RepID=A0ABV6FAI9_9BURK
MSRFNASILPAPRAAFWKPLILALGLGTMGAIGPVQAAPAETAAPAPPNTRAGIDTNKCARPEYPSEEAAQQHRGTVQWRFLIGADGWVVDAKLDKSSGYPALDEAARSALVKCRFKPPLTRDGKPARAWVPVQYVWN